MAGHKKAKWLVLASLLGLSACAAAPAPSVVRNGSLTMVQGTQAQVEELCRRSAGDEKTYKGGRILGCWIPERRTIVFERNNWCIGLHEALHALGWEHGPWPNTKCDGKEELWRTKMRTSLREVLRTSEYRRR